MSEETRLPTPLYSAPLFLRTTLLSINHPRLEKEKNISLTGLLPSLFTLVLER